MNKLFALIALILTLAFSGAATAVAHAQGNHEYAPLVEKAINYKDWTFKSLKDDKPVNLREWAKGKRLVMIVYFAPWCPNWHNEAPVAAKLYEKYKLQGFDVIGVSEYGSREDTQKFFGEKGAPYTIVYDRTREEQRDKTSHYTVRQASGDTRRWGRPTTFSLTVEAQQGRRGGDGKSLGGQRRVDRGRCRKVYPRTPRPRYPGAECPERDALPAVENLVRIDQSAHHRRRRERRGSIES